MKKPEVLPENSIEIDGVIYTAEMRLKMREWHNVGESPYEPSRPQCFVEYLSAIQDYFCRIIADAQFDENMRKEITMMSNIIYMKDDLQVFVPKIKHEEV